MYYLRIFFNSLPVAFSQGNGKSPLSLKLFFTYQFLENKYGYYRITKLTTDKKGSIMWWLAGLLVHMSCFFWLLCACGMCFAEKSFSSLALHVLFTQLGMLFPPHLTWPNPMHPLNFCFLSLEAPFLGILPDIIVLVILYGTNFLLSFQQMT